MLEGPIFKRLILFQDFSFEVIDKPGKINVGPDHFSHLEFGESGGPVDDQISDAYLFQFESIIDYLSDYGLFFMMGTMPEGYSTTQKRNLVVFSIYYQLTMKDLIFYGNVIVELLKDMLVVRKLLERSYREDYGGR
jgi:hypothetical protein